MAVSLAGCGKRVITLTTERISVQLGEEVKVDVSALADLTEKDLEKASLDFTEVDDKMLGEYIAYLVYEEDKYPFTVEIHDTTAPVAVVEQTVVVPAGITCSAESMVREVTELTGTVTISFRDNVYDVSALETEEVAENQEMVENYADTEIEEDLDMEEDDSETEKEFQMGLVTCSNDSFVYKDIGEYDNVLIVMDASGNKTEYPFHVVACVNPTLNGVTDIKVTKGTEVNYLEGIGAADCFGNDISSNIVCDSASVDVSQPGTYAITYSVKDGYGFNAQQAASVYVEEVKNVRQDTDATAENGQSQNSSGSENFSSSGVSEGWVPYSTGSLSQLVDMVANGYVVYYNGQYWVSPEYIKMLDNTEVHTNNILPEESVNRYSLAEDFEFPSDSEDGGMDLDGF